MNNIKRKINIDLQKNKMKGFTLVETLVASFILTFTITALMTVVADSLFTARYARSEITAIYLAQEVSDYIRNDRDAFFLKEDGTSWDEFLNIYNLCTITSTEGEEIGCYFEVLALLRNEESIESCNEDTETGCPFLHYNENEDTFYTYIPNDDEKPRFQRKIFIKKELSWQDQDEITLTVTVLWKEGTIKKETVLETTLTKWQ
jgi:hypothetical protein